MIKKQSITRGGGCRGRGTVYEVCSMKLGAGVRMRGRGTVCEVCSMTEWGGVEAWGRWKDEGLRE